MVQFCSLGTLLASLPFVDCIDSGVARLLLLLAGVVHKVTSARVQFLQALALIVTFFLNVLVWLELFVHFPCKLVAVCAYEG